MKKTASKWYDISCKADGDTTTINIFDQIGEDWYGEGVTAKGFIAKLSDIKTGKIELFINSSGGSVFDGNAIYNAIVAHKATIHVTILGVAASIASVIAMAGDTISMPSNTYLMIHNPTSGFYGCADGMRAHADLLDSIKDGAVNTYAKQSGQPTLDIAEMMDNETWMTAADALEKGFIDDITDAIDVNIDATDLSMYKNLTNEIKHVMKLEDTASEETAGQPINNKEVSIMEITVEMVKENPDVYNAILKEGVTSGRKMETERVVDVQALSMIGHEALVTEMLLDGETTSEQAAIKILTAEKAIKADMAAKHSSDAPKVVATVINDTIEDKKIIVDENLPAVERAKMEWDADSNSKAEFDGDYEAFEAYFVANDSGLVKQLS